MKIPYIGFGTNIVKNNTIIKNALSTGYRHFDTATFYNNIGLIGREINKSNISRDKFFITSKLWTEEHGYKESISSIKSELLKSQMDYLDLYLIHSPIGGKIKETYEGINYMKKEGYVKEIGVSNFQIKDLEEFYSHYKYYPKINQIEFNIKNQNKELIKYCKKQGIMLTIYSPFSKGDLDNELLNKLSEKYTDIYSQKVCKTKIILSWIKEYNFDSILMHSSNINRMKENIKENNIKLEEEDIEKITMLDDKKSCINWEEYL